MFLTLMVRGLAVGVNRYLGEPMPVWMDEAFPTVFVVSGFAVGYGLLRLIWCWVPLFLDARSHKLLKHLATEPSVPAS